VRRGFAALWKVEQQVRQSRREAQEILADTRAAAEKVRAEMEQAAKEKAAELVARARDQIDTERERALQEVRTTVVDFSLSLASKVIERNLTTEDNRKLVEESLHRIGEA
jgi:F-type H+-transporting ATPase subunit b